MRLNRALVKRENKKVNEKLFDDGSEYVESAEQLRVRLHSHLLTGRVANRSLLTFASEVQKKLYDENRTSDYTKALN